MSQDNVELVRRLQPDLQVDLVALLRDDAAARASGGRAAPFFHPDCECLVYMPGAELAAYLGLDGLRAGWLDWLAPWSSYHTEIEQLIDLDDRVVVLVRDYGRRAPDAPEVRQIGGAVWTVCDGRVARVEFYTDRHEALEAVGLEG